MGASWAWTPGTNGPATGNVEFIDPSSADDFVAHYAGTLRGKWVMTRPPGWVHNSDFGPMMHADSLQLDSVLRAGRTMTDAQRRFRHDLPALVAREGAFGDPDRWLQRVRTLDDERIAAPTRTRCRTSCCRMRRTRCSRDFAQWREGHVAGGHHEHIDRGYAVRAQHDRRDPGNGAPGAGGAARGASRFVGPGHWHDGQRGGGIAVLEAARILAAAKVRPARTIRFALFTGEEEGLLGSAAYVRAHESELGNYQAVLVLDNGTGRITGIALQGRRELHDAWASMLAPISALGPFSIRSANKGGTDHLSFLPYGVPGSTTTR